MNRSRTIGVTFRGDQPTFLWALVIMLSGDVTKVVTVLVLSMDGALEVSRSGGLEETELVLF